MRSPRNCVPRSKWNSHLYNVSVSDFESWRFTARHLITAGVPPSKTHWHTAKADQSSLFDDSALPAAAAVQFSVTREFINFAKTIACHRDDVRWELLYSVLWRLVHGEPHILALATDPLIRCLDTMYKQVRRDAHKAKAFVRFRLADKDGEEHYIAWHRPDHLIIPLVAPFFARRFSSMRWTILTPDASASWDGESLHFGQGVAVPDTTEDSLEDLWREYYRATFNPARIKIKAMKREMPVRYWDRLPESTVIQELLRDAPSRVEKMIAHQEGLATSAADYIPDDHAISSLRQASKDCKGCPLFEDAHQIVFGEGPERASLVLVGEQPGDEEDKSGHPFVGPAGKILNDALRQAGINRNDVYVTNAVKHFRFTFRGEQRQHRSPALRHIHACKPWLVTEIEAIKPKAIVCLGNTAARSLISQGFTMKTGRGQWTEVNGQKILATYHPSAVLRGDPAQRQKLMQLLVEDLSMAAYTLLKEPV